MKRIGLYMFMAAALVQGCTDDSYRGSSEDLYGGGSVSIPVVVALGDVDRGVAKGMGAVDDIAEWGQGSFYVYAFNRARETSYRNLSSQSPVDCLVDASRDETGSLEGKKAHIDLSNAYAVWDSEDAALLYPSGKDAENRYDFFAYYTDDIRPSAGDIHRFDDSVVLSVKIDGTQDIMSSKAEVTSDQLEKFTEKGGVFIKENAYSLYTAQRNVMPTFYFKHHLVRLEFDLFSGVVREEVKRVSVHGIELRSKYDADFTVAAKNADEMGLSFKPETKFLVLTEEGGHEMEKDKYFMTTRLTEEEKERRVKFGGCLLLAPDVEYEAYITMSEVREDGTPVKMNHRTPLNISYGDSGFEAGHQYRVKLVIYGINQVATTVDLEKWQEGGTLDMDTENDRPDI